MYKVLMVRSLELAFSFKGAVHARLTHSDHSCTFLRSILVKTGLKPQDLIRNCNNIIAIPNINPSSKEHEPSSII